jgi:TP901 family phage tail tape measure protein
MADLEKTVAVIFKGDDQISKTISNISRSFSGFSTMAQNVAEPLANIAEGVLAADAALSAMAIGGMAIAIRESGKFGDAFNEIATLIDVPRENLDGFRRDILDYAKDSTASFEEINGAVYQAISFGNDYADSLDFLRSAEKLNVAGKGDLISTTELLAGTLNAYGESVDKAGRYSDVFFTVVKDGKTTLREQAEGLSQVTSLAAEANVPVEVLGAALAALTASGDPTTLALTKIKGILSAIIKPSQGAAEAAKQLNLDFSLAALESKGLAGFLHEVFEATGGNASEMTKLFGRVEALNGALSLGADRSGAFARALEDMRDVSGTVDAAYQKMADNISIINQSIENNIRAVLIALGDQMIGGYIEVAGGIKEVFQGIGTAIDAGTFAPLFEAFDQFAAELATFLQGMASAMPDALAQLDFSGFIGALRDLGGAIGDLFGDIDLTDADDLADVMQEIIDTGEALIRVTSGMALAFKPYFDALRLAIQEVNSWDAETQTSFGKVLLAAEMVVRAGVLVVGAMAAIEQSGTDIRNVFDVVVGSIRAAWNSLQVAFDTVASIVVNAVIDILDAVEPLTRLPGMEGLNQSIKDIRESLGYMSEAIRIDSAGQMQEVLNGLGQAMDGFTGSAGEAAAAAGTVAERVREIPEEKTTFLEFSDDIARQDIIEFERFYLDKINTDGTTIEILPIIAPDGSVLNELNQTLDRAQSAADSDPPVIKPEVDTEEAESQLERLRIGAGLIEEAMRLEAEVDIAMAQEATRRLQAAFDSVNVSIQSTGETLVGLFGALNEVEGISNRWLVEDAIRQEIDLRQQAFNLQSRLVNSTIALNKAQSERLESGDAFITISTEGLTPALELVLMEIVERIQMQVISSGSQALIDLAQFSGV